MKLEQVADHVGALPYMRFKQAQKIQKIITKYDSRSILELGFFHGVSTMYMAATLDELGGERSIITIDKVIAKTNQPNIEQLARELGLEKYISVFYEERTYLWRLMKFIEEGRRFDFCYLDGGHNWGDTGFAFFLVDKLLVEGGLILFDDFNWTAEGKDWAKEWPLEEQQVSPVERTWELLVGEHPRYKQLWVDGAWALARKKRKIPLFPVYY